MLYQLIKPALFCLEPERAHALTLAALNRAHAVGLLSSVRAAEQSGVEMWGLRFPNRVGIAAGLDKNAVAIDAFGALGVGFVEIGTVTPKPQAGNPPPRVFRIPHAGALINRMGFPNEGMDTVAERLRARKGSVICGVNIGKNASTTLERAVDDYLACLRRLAPFADYITINVSSPNTVGLRNLQAAEHLRPMLQSLLDARSELLRQRVRPLPLLVKLAPDLAEDDLHGIADLLLELKVDGVIATNTTITRPANLGVHAAQAGGLSGQPVHELALQSVARLRQRVGSTLPIVGVGGVASLAQARAMRQAGADLVQVYTGLIYRGPDLLKELIAQLD